MTAPRAGLGRKPPRGWNARVWGLRAALLAARERLPYASAQARLLDGVERWVRLQGPGRSPETHPEWWAQALALTKASAAVCDGETRLLLAPWVGLVHDVPVAGTGFRPFGG